MDETGLETTLWWFSVHFAIRFLIYVDFVSFTFTLELEVATFLSSSSTWYHSSKNYRTFDIFAPKTNLLSKIDVLSKTVDSYANERVNYKNPCRQTENHKSVFQGYLAIEIGAGK